MPHMLADAGIQQQCAFFSYSSSDSCCNTAFTWLNIFITEFLSCTISVFIGNYFMAAMFKDTARSLDKTQLFPPTLKSFLFNLNCPCSR